ncbi:hypothetical protein PsorP6_000673 [Peronosclerospora sorghi]|uniref:Uncharacterized protein n=1 Tax=Peronosclerospora sorghi TaxID=230839 RepID=A0ACC0WR19_9STRA|nr:hypothetical protein PsorP6_000673 [Peronosclerospora sorghi]
MGVPPPAGRRKRDGKLYASARQKRPKCRRFAMGIVVMLSVGVKRTSPYSFQVHKRVSPSVAMPREKLALLSLYLTPRWSSSHAKFVIERARSTLFRNDRYELFVSSIAVRASTVTLPSKLFLTFAFGTKLSSRFHHFHFTSSSVFSSSHRDRIIPGHPD